MCKGVSSTSIIRVRTVRTYIFMYTAIRTGDFRNTYIYIVYICYSVVTWKSLETLVVPTYTQLHTFLLFVESKSFEDKKKFDKLSAVLG